MEYMYTPRTHYLNSTNKSFPVMYTSCCWTLPNSALFTKLGVYDNRNGNNESNFSRNL